MAPCFAIIYMMPKWATDQRRKANGQVEDICIHGIGHPNKNWLALFEPTKRKTLAVHCCDGCCLIFKKEGAKNHD